MKVLLSGGGTGGHVYPAIAIADKIKENHPDAEIMFVGTQNGIESQLVPNNGYEIKTITIQGFKRKIDLENGKRVITLCKGLNEASKIIKEFKPDLVIGTGGYVSAPILFISSVNKNITTIIHEQNSFPGVTNKILSTTVSKVLTSFDESHKRFPSTAKDKLYLTGNPVRKEILNTNKETARETLNISPDKKMVLCYGGSGGSRKINDSMVKLVKDMLNNDLAFIFATGKNFYDSFMQNFENINFNEYQRIVPYLNDMPNALAACDVVITSAGAISLAEITAKGKPCVIIPKAYTAENHQEYNAKSIEKENAGVCILEKDLTDKLLSNTVLDLLDDNERLITMSNNSKNIGNVDAIDCIYEQIMESYNLNNKNKDTSSKNKDLSINIKPIKIKKKTR